MQFRASWCEYFVIACCFLLKECILIYMICVNIIRVYIYVYMYIYVHITLVFVSSPSWNTYVRVCSLFLTYLRATAVSESSHNVRILNCNIALAGCSFNDCTAVFCTELLTMPRNHIVPVSDVRIRTRSHWIDTAATCAMRLLNIAMRRLL